MATNVAFRSLVFVLDASVCFGLSNCSDALKSIYTHQYTKLASCHSPLGLQNTSDSIHFPVFCLAKFHYHLLDLPYFSRLPILSEFYNSIDQSYTLLLATIYLRIRGLLHFMIVFTTQKFCGVIHYSDTFYYDSRVGTYHAKTPESRRTYAARL